MTLQFLSHSKSKPASKERYYISQFDSDTYQIIDSIEDREICVVSNYDEWEDAEQRAKKIVDLLNANYKKTLG
ncbi:MAG: hypothetical protein QM730_11040 [Anaerolineales bacterium]